MIELSWSHREALSVEGPLGEAYVLSSMPGESYGQYRLCLTERMRVCKVVLLKPANSCGTGPVVLFERVSGEPELLDQLVCSAVAICQRHVNSLKGG